MITALKSISKKSIILMMVVVLAMTVAVTVGGEQTSAKSTGKSFYITEHGYAYLSTSEDSSNIYASVEVPYDTYVKVVFTTQRYYSGAWHSIESKTDYAKYAWGSHYNANVQFSGYAYKGQSTRVRAKIYDPWSGSYTCTVYSPSWVR